MATFKSFKDLSKKVHDGIYAALQGEVNEIVQKIAVDKANAQFDTTNITRKDNLNSTVTASNTLFQLTVENHTPPDPSYLGQEIYNSDPSLLTMWAEEGLWMDFGHFLETGEKIKRPAKPFIQPAQEAVNAKQASITKKIEQRIKK